MNLTPVLSRAFGDMTALWFDHAGSLVFTLVPASRAGDIVPHRDRIPSAPANRGFGPDGMDVTVPPSNCVQYKLSGDAMCGHFAPGITLRDSESVRRLAFKESHDLPDGVELVFEDAARALTAVQTLRKDPDAPCVQVSTTLENRGAAPVRIEFLSSFSLGFLSPFRPDAGPGAYRVLRWRSFWSNEGRLESLPAEELGLEMSWSGSGVRNLRFGSRSTMPVQGWFPQIGLADTAAGVVWGASVASFGAWELDLSRFGEFFSLAGGLPSRDTCGWFRDLAPGESFASPVCALTCATVPRGARPEDALTARLAPFSATPSAETVPPERDLPVLFNEWCTTWGTPSEANLRPIAERLRALPVRHFVLDSGWFGSFGGAVGDWLVKEELYPRGLPAFLDDLRGLGFNPGIWFEFAVAQETSHVYKEHPDWFLTLDGHVLRHAERAFLDFRLPAVRDFLRERVAGLIARAHVGFIKVDYNGTPGFGCDGPSASPAENLRAALDAEVAFFRELKAAFPELVIEVCASGGHRLSPAWMRLGALASSSDAHEGVEIPILAANTAALVSPRSNEIWATLRPWDTPDREYYSLTAAMMGRLCVSGDVGKLSEEQFRVLSEGLAFQRTLVPLLRNGSARYVRHLDTPSYNDPRGAQFFLLESPDETLVVFHSFAAPAASYTLPLGDAAGRLRVLRRFGAPSLGVSLGGGGLAVSSVAPFQGLALVLGLRALRPMPPPPSAPRAPALREKNLFDDNWLFHRGDLDPAWPSTKGAMYMSAKTERVHMGPAAPGYLAEADSYRNDAEYKSERWDAVSLPHDYLAGDIPDPRENSALGFVRSDNAWYRKTFSLPASDDGRRITLLFEGVAKHATVYLNGCLLKHNFCGYTPFEVDITDVARYGAENVLAVYVGAHEIEGWWYEGAGIYRHVWLVKTSPVALDLWGVYVRAVPHAAGAQALPAPGTPWKVTVEATVRNDGLRPRRVRAVSEILAPDGSPVLTLEARGSVAPFGKAALTACGSVAAPRLWDLDSPILYTCRTRVFLGAKESDADETRFGFRSVRMDPEKGLFLNGRHRLLQGVCGHESFGLVGRAVPDNLQREKVLMLREMGANAFRMSHYPQAAALMDAMDSLGMLVMDETRWFESSEEGLAQLETLVRRDRSRPSVVMWSVGNEEPLFTTEQGRRICRRMMALVRRLDPDRPVMTANDKSPMQAAVYDECDIVGINYNLGLYDEVHAKYPGKAVFSSECCATGTTRGWYYPDNPAAGRVSAYDKDTNAWFRGREATWKFLAARPWVMGGFQWHAYEYRGEAAWPRLCSISGAVDLFWQKKDAFYQNQSFWTDAPMVHLLPHWNFRGREGEPIRVSAYTNCDGAELFLNGESLGKREVERFGHAEWSVPYAPGELRVVATRGGKTAAEDVRVTSGPGVRLELSLLNHEPVRANGRDIALVSARVLDAGGREVPDASPLVRFATDGSCRVLATGSDDTDHTGLCLSERRMYAGRVTAAVRVGTAPGPLHVWAEADSLAAGCLTLRT